VRDIDTAVVDSLKVLDPNRPIREATVQRTSRLVRFVPRREVAVSGLAATAVGFEQRIEHIVAPLVADAQIVAQQAFVAEPELFDQLA
jgi:hypothetical protein